MIDGELSKDALGLAAATPGAGNASVDALSSSEMRESSKERQL